LHESLNKLVVDSLAELALQGHGDAPIPVPPFVAVVERLDGCFKVCMPIAQRQSLGLVLEGASGQAADGQQV